MPQSSDAIRRRLNREYVVITAPSRLDGTTADKVRDTIGDVGDDCDLVIDLRTVEHCEDGVIDALDEAALELNHLGASLTLSHPPESVEVMLDDQVKDRAFVVRRPRQTRPVRRSLRSQL